MNLLFEQFPDTVEVDGRQYSIVTDFREWIKLHELLKETETFTPGILGMILDWYVDEVPENIQGAVAALGDFMAVGGLWDGQEDVADESEEEDRPGKPVFSFSQDAVFIYSAFREVYGIDLEGIGYLHWWKFKALFDGLPSDTEIKERIYYRSIDLKTVKDKEERKRIQKIQGRIAIKEKKHRKLTDYEIGDFFA